MAEVNMEQLLNCAFCPNMCRSECPVLQVTGREAVAPAGKARISALLNEGKLDWNEAFLEAVSNCLGCRGCTIHCPFPDLNLCDELLYTRMKADSKGIGLPILDPYLNNLKKYSSPYGQKTGVISTANRDADFLIFNGCTSLANNPASIKATMSLLDRAGISYQMIEEDCCGYPAQVWGNQELARQLAAENKQKFRASGASTLVTSCPECWLTFTDRYPDLDQALPLEVIDGPSFFFNLVKEGYLKPKKKADGEGLGILSYHDPCIWARTARKVNEPREIIEKIPGIKLKEPLSSKDHTRCCGGGSMFQLAFPGTASAIARRRLDEFPQKAAIITACPFCREGLLQEDRPVWELVELLEQFFE